jgi:hypothetical protein
MDKTLFEDMLTHTKVLERIGFAAGGFVILGQNSDTTQMITSAQNMLQERQIAIITQIVGCPVVPIDSKSAIDYYDKNTRSLKTKTVRGFEPTNVAAVPTSGQIGTIKSYRQLAFEADNGQQLAWFDGGRTLLTTRYVSETKEMQVESEGGWLCVPSVSRQMGYGKVTE